MPLWRGCARCSYASRLGRPSLILGGISGCCSSSYFEGLSSERGIAWRVAHSLSLRAFLDLDVIRGAAEPLDAVAHAASDRRGNARGGFHVGAGTVRRERVVVQGKTVPRCDERLEANAAMRSDRAAGYRGIL